MNSSSGFAMNNGKRRTVYSEGPKHGRNSNVGPSLSHSNSKIPDIVGVGNNMKVHLKLLIKWLL